MWKHDLFEITVSSLWTLQEGTDCLSVKQEGINNHFNGTHSNPYVLDCVWTAKVTTPTANSQKVYIYGLNTDIDVSAHGDYRRPEIWVPNFKNPAEDWGEDNYSWTLSTVRFQTRTTLETKTITGSPRTEPATISSVTWEPTWKMTESYLVGGEKVLMDLTFVLVNDIEANGETTITFLDTINGYTLGGGAGCFVASHITSTSSTNTVYTLSCSVHDATTAKFSAMPAMSVKQSITSRYPVTLQASGAISSVASIVVKSTNGNVVSETNVHHGLIRIKEATLGLLLDNFGITLGSETVENNQAFAGGMKSNVTKYHFRWKYQANAGRPVDQYDKVTISCPIS
jgi:hypothetical protein